jgi:hypothetical protein
MLNRLFAEQGLAYEPGHITAATITLGTRDRVQPEAVQAENLPRDPRRPDKHIDPATHIWPINEWGPACRRGFVRTHASAPGLLCGKRTGRPRASGESWTTLRKE